MPKRRKFEGESVTRLIVSVPVSVVGEIDRVTGCKYPNRYNRHPAFGNRSEFVRLAIVEKLERDQVIIEAFRCESINRCSLVAKVMHEPKSDNSPLGSLFSRSACRATRCFILQSSLFKSLCALTVLSAKRQTLLYSNIGTRFSLLI